eukprot:gb/GECH01012296.1/.p1 GENE.gb/GECH01012296.1/~~gb/GECH01012296.1/.p1  ORF type:complete len:169 (+),score=33.52 gb/GECH01012296.1/:1-507(+)
MSVSAGDLPKGVNKEIETFKRALSDIEEHIQPFLKQNLTELSDNLDPLKRAKLHVTMAYTVNTLFFMYLRTQGIDPKDHPVSSEIERVKSYMQKVGKAEDNLNAKRSLYVDKEAAGRIIKHAMNSGKAKQNKKRKESDSSDDETNDKRKRRRKNSQSSTSFTRKKSNS